MHVEDKRKLLMSFKDTSIEFKNLDNYFFTAFLYSWSKPRIRDVRILPMSAKEFPGLDTEELKSSFFMNQLLNVQKSHYHFPDKGMKAEKGTLILFQFKNEIIACANLLEIEKYEEPLYGKYKGSYVFEPDSIRVFESITADELKEVDQNFKQFSQVKQKLNPAVYEDLMIFIQLKSNLKIPEEIFESENVRYYEGTKKQITVNVFERNSKARQECIRTHGSRCIICGFDFGESYGENFIGKIHVHHKKPLHEVDESYIVDPEKDLIPVCPNCHLVLHSKPNGTYTVEEVKELLVISYERK